MIYINQYACKKCQKLFDVELEVERGERKLPCITCGEPAERLIDVIVREIAPKKDDKNGLTRKK